MNGQQNLFSESLYDYLFVIEPDPATATLIRQLKQLLHDRIVLSWANLNSKPHLSLFEFQNVESAEEEIIRKTAALLKNTGPFPVGLDGLVVFEHGKVSRSLVLKIKDPKAIVTLHHALRREIHLKPRKITPHATIARDIPAAAFAKLESIDEFDYKGAFDCSKITLLKKISGGKASFKPLHEFTLK